MLISHIVNVIDYGASGNGVDDDYQAILDACRCINSRRGGTLYFPKGVYRINRHRIARSIGQYEISNFEFEDCDGITIEGNGSINAPRDNRKYKQGDVVFNSNPTAAGTIGWVCVRAGQPGVWKEFGSISS